MGKEDDTDFLDSLAAVETSRQYAYLEKACRGVAVVKKTSFGQNKDKEKCAFMEMVILKAEPIDERKPHLPGEEVSHAENFERGKKEIRDMKLRSFKRNLCAIAGVDPKDCTPEQWTKIAKAFKEDGLVGLTFNFVPKDGKSKKEDGTPMVFFNFTSRQNTKESVARNKELLAKGADAKEFVL